MAYVIVDSCTKDENCIEACPIDCIHPRKDEGKFAEVPHQSRWVHRLRRMCAGVRLQFHLPHWRPAGEFEGFRRKERRLLQV